MYLVLSSADPSSDLPFSFLPRRFLLSVQNPTKHNLLFVSLPNTILSILAELIAFYLFSDNPSDILFQSYMFSTPDGDVRKRSNSANRLFDADVSVPHPAVYGIYSLHCAGDHWEN